MTDTLTEPQTNATPATCTAVLYNLPGVSPP